MFNISRVIIFSSVIILVISGIYLKKINFLDSISKGGLITLIFILVLFIISLLDFNSLFFKFHEIVFTNNLWMLNSATDNLIRLLPEKIFLDILKRILFISFIFSIVTFFVPKKL